MDYIIEHKTGNITLSVTGSNISKHKIVDGVLTERQCGDCKLFLDFDDFRTRVRYGRLIINTKCEQCHKVRKLVGRSLKKFGKDSSTEVIIGISYHDFILWLDQGDLKHTDKGLHIDHCVPQSLGQDREDMKILNHYSNLQLMDGTENLSKNNRYINKIQLERVLLYSPNPKRIMEILEISKIKIV